MATKRKTTKLRRGDILAVEEYHDGRYGAPGMPRQKKKKPTKEDMQRVNAMNKAKLCQYRLLQYFTEGDYFATLTYRVDARPPDMETAKKHWTDLRKRITKEYRKRGEPLFWVRNIERGTRGAWHIHLAITRITDTARILEEAWEYGGVYLTQIKKSKYYSEDFAELAAYLTKGKYTREKRADGSEAHIKEHAASGSASGASGALAERGKAEERILHRPDTRGDQPENRVQIQKIYPDPAEQEDLNENGEDLHRDIIRGAGRKGREIRGSFSIY